MCVAMLNRMEGLAARWVCSRMDARRNRLIRDRSWINKRRDRCQSRERVGFRCRY